MWHAHISQTELELVGRMERPYTVDDVPSEVVYIWAKRVGILTFIAIEVHAVSGRLSTEVIEMYRHFHTI